MAKILLLETSGAVCSAAISLDGSIVALAETQEAPSHSALLTLQIQDCTQKAGIPLADLDAVAISHGPGAYTSLRVGASVAKGICYALDKPLIAVNTLLALAHASRASVPSIPGVSGPHFYVPMLDARRQEIWVAIYDSELQEIAPAQPLIVENNLFFKFVTEKTGGVEISGVILSGSGMEKTRSGEFSEKIIFSDIEKSSAIYLSALAEQHFQMADFQDIAYFEPVYMKPPNITSSTKPLF
jgi:tRNA threonylcarbamoyladenosine biosynthesis protein TsaB